MKIVNKLLLLSAIVLFLVGNFQFTEARSGCCSSHGGVCSCAVSGNKCCDGTSLSKTCAPYYPACVEKSAPKPPPKPEPKQPKPKVEPKPKPETKTETKTNTDEQVNTDTIQKEEKQESVKETTEETKPAPEVKTEVTETKNEKADKSNKDDKLPISGSTVEAVKNESDNNDKAGAGGFITGIIVLTLLFGTPLTIIAVAVLRDNYVRERNRKKD
ncbi:MAG: hypothetical protein HQ530_01870 [Parcubacteria group bacterium]|nr:hypothetical protein [Parcubacteria group bacterium]